MRNPRRKITVGISLIVVIILIAVVMTFMRRPSQPSDKAAGIPKMAAKAVMYLAGVHQTATKDGVVQWKLQALSAELEAATGKMRLLSPEIDFFLKDGDRVHMTADKGVLNTKTNDIRARGNVRVHDSRYTLVTETLSYEHDTRVLHSKSPVQIKSATMSLKAKEVWYNLNTQRALFSGNVQGKLDEEFTL